MVADLNLPTADQVLLDLTRLIAGDEATPEGVAAAIELFQRYGLIEAAFGPNGWTSTRFLATLRETIDLLDDADQDDTRAAEYVLDLANDTAR